MAQNGLISASCVRDLSEKIALAIVILMLALANIS